MKYITETEQAITPLEAKGIVKTFGLRLPKHGSLVRVVRPNLQHHFGLRDYVVYRRNGQWYKQTVLD